jgi:hypothetical protein
MASSTKALNIVPIVDEIIWLSHAGSCENINRRSPFYFDPNTDRFDLQPHLRALSQCILVCKLWAKIGIPQLWSSYTTEINLLSLINTVHWRDILREGWDGVSTIDTKVSNLKKLQIYYYIGHHSLNMFLPPDDTSKSLTA